jgi:hypothetical protein
MGQIIKIEGEVDLDGNIFQDNTCDKACIHIIPLGPYSPLAPWYNTGGIVRNQFHNNTGSQLIYINARGDSCDFKYNNFTSNKVHNNPSSSTLSWTGNLVIQYNLFDNPDIQFEVIVLNPWDSPADLRYNWWGSSDKGFVEQSIWDFYDDRTLSLANYSPYLLEPSFTGALSLNDTQMWFINDHNWLRGNVLNDFTLLANQTYYLNGTVYIPKGITLTIEPGVIFLCERNSGKIFSFFYIFLPFLVLSYRL